MNLKAAFHKAAFSFLMLGILVIYESSQVVVYFFSKIINHKLVECCKKLPLFDVDIF